MLRGFAAVGLCGRCACGRGALRECARCRCAWVIERGAAEGWHPACCRWSLVRG